MHVTRGARGARDTWCTWRNRVAYLSVTNTAASVRSSHATLVFPRRHNTEDQRAMSIFRVMKSVLCLETICTAHRIVRAITSRRMGWGGCVARMGEGRGI